MASCKECYHYEVCRMHYQQKCELTYETEKEVRHAMLEAEKGSPICEHFADCSRFAELSHAEWVEDEDTYGDPIYHCSNCNEHFVLEEGTPTDNCYSYCPNCGAKMDEQALKERNSE